MTACGYVSGTTAVLDVVSAQLMAEGQGNYSICLRHQWKINPIVMLFKGFANSRGDYRSRRELMATIRTRPIECHKWHRTLSNPLLMTTFRLVPQTWAGAWDGSRLLQDTPPAVGAACRSTDSFCARQRALRHSGPYSTSFNYSDRRAGSLHNRDLIQKGRQLEKPVFSQVLTDS